MSLQQADEAFLRDLIARRSGNVISEQQSYLMEARLSRVAESAGLVDVHELVSELQRHPCAPLHRTVTEAMTINETSFFRDVEPFETLKNEVLPALIQARQDRRKLSIWSAACSSGQEAYSIAMLIRSVFPELDSWDARILATDVSETMVTRTQLGMFSQFEVSRGLPTAMLVSSCDRIGLNWQVKPHIANLIQARSMNLADRWQPVEKHDVVLLRNVLIYFDQNTKTEILRKMYHAIPPDGYLFLGGGETLLNLDVPFRPVSLGKFVCFQPIQNLS